MASSKKAAKAQSAAQDAWTNPYVQRLVQDEELRDNLKVAYLSAKSAYGRISNGKAQAKVVTDDKRFQKDVKKAGEALRDASVALKDGPKKRRRGGLGRLLLLAIVGGGLALALSEDLRNKVLDALFGAEEEFDYTSTTTAPPPPTPAPRAWGPGRRAPPRRPPPPPPRRPPPPGRAAPGREPTCWRGRPPGALSR